MRDRLIGIVKSSLMMHIGKSCNLAENIVDDLLNENVIVPPVEIGQTVWYIYGGYYNSANKRPCAIEVTEINKKRQHGKVEWGFIANGTRYKFSSIGKSVFLSLKEAEQALAERKSDNGHP